MELKPVDLTTIDAVLLDMDGTLVDSDAAVERAWRAWAGEHGIEPAAALAISTGCTSEHTVRRLLPHLDDAAVAVSAARELELQYDDLSDVTPATGAHELVAVLERLCLPWAVVTSADVRLATARLGAARITAPLLVTAEDVAHSKPDPQGYLQAAEQLGVTPGRCLVVEDAEPGLAAGRAAGAMTAALKGLTGDVCLDNLGQLATLLTDAAGGPRV
ncbi:HAD-IA family hydrolase [Pengzhenrongella sicca]|uniref:HAD-IA family hydrolase n=1 Tax=Pengzhenrongella sicca TaxID=2819238 RepID=UPI001D0C87BB|nr:HAD-IA family hydrolase [Pengzhenrongella sicca]